jgi:hypothetical protein
MPVASWAQVSFLGGEWSETAQGRFDDPAYETALNVCLNGLPVEAGAWTRRPGTMFAQTTRNGAPGRVIGFNHKQAQANTLEFTDNHLRIRQGPTLITQNDSVTVTSISTANPAVALLSNAVTWSIGDQGYFTLLSTSCPLLQNRVFALTKIDTTHFSLSDPITGANIDGATLGVSGLAVGTMLNRILDISSPYSSGSWADLRAVQTDIKLANGTTPGMVLLNQSFAPYVLQVVTPPGNNTYATFSLAAANIKDGPYLDPVPGGTLVTPSATIGIITMTLSFNAYDATRAYSIGDYVTNAGNNYKSLVDANLGSAPPSANWVAVSGADAIGPNGFQGSDVGRHVRLLSEPLLYDPAHAYTGGELVTYGGQYPLYQQATYYKATAASTGVYPGTDATKWAIAPNAARWTWGKITGLSNIIDRALAGSVNIGNMTSGGGLAAAFDGVLTQSAAASAEAITSGVTVYLGTVSLSSYVGKNYSGASNQKIQQAIVYPSSDSAVVVSGTYDFGAEFPTRPIVASDYTLTTIYNLRAKASVPSSSSDGTLLGTTGTVTSPFTSQQTIVSGDQTTAWAYVWVEQVTSIQFVSRGLSISYSLANAVAELTLFNPTGSGTSQGFTLQVIGDPLLTTNVIRVWRLGAFSATTSFPTVGTYHEDGRLWLSGAIANRIDGSRSNDPFNFAPTDPDGSVPANSAITYRFNAKDINPVLWMESDERGILCGTQGAEWLVTATTQNLPLSATNIQAHPVSRYGSQNVEPKRAGGVLVFVQRFGRKLLEFFADVFSGRLTAPNLTRNARHLTETFVEELAYQAELAPIIWARRGDGELVGTTYKRENLVSGQLPAFNGWHRHTLGSSRTVESICTGPSTDGNLDALTMVTNDASGVRHVEIMTNIWEEGSNLTTAWFLDDAVTPASFTINVGTQRLTINGLWHLNAKTVTAFVAGVDAGDYVVTNGSITVPIDGTAHSANGTSPLTVASGLLTTSSVIVVGFTYNSDAQLLRGGPQKDSGAATGPAAGKVARIHQFAALLIDTCGGIYASGGSGPTWTYSPAGIAFGSDFNDLDPLLKNADTTQVAEATLVNAVVWAPFKNPYTFDEGQPCWRIARPYPATIGWFSAYQMTQDR